MLSVVANVAMLETENRAAGLRINLLLAGGGHGSTRSEHTLSASEGSDGRTVAGLSKIPLLGRWLTDGVMVSLVVDDRR